MRADDGNRFKVEVTLFAEAYSDPPGAFAISRSVLTVTASELRLRRRWPLRWFQKARSLAPVARISLVNREGSHGAWLEWTNHDEDVLHGARIQFTSTGARERFVQLVGLTRP